MGAQFDPGLCLNQLRDHAVAGGALDPLERFGPVRWNLFTLQRRDLRVLYPYPMTGVADVDPACILGLDSELSAR